MVCRGCGCGSFLVYAGKNTWICEPAVGGCGSTTVENKRICPVCRKNYTEHPALSRKDNKTEICPECGMKEAFESMFLYRKKVISEKN